MKLKSKWLSKTMWFNYSILSTLISVAVLLQTYLPSMGFPPERVAMAMFSLSVFVLLGNIVLRHYTTEGLK